MSPPLVALHAIGQDSSAWSFLNRPGLSPINLPGHGGSLGLPAPMTLDDVAERVLEQCPATFDLLGIALGGLVAEYLICNAPDRVNSAIIGCCSVALSPQASAGFADRSKRLRDGEPLDADGFIANWFTPAARLSVEHDAAVSYARRAVSSTPAPVLAAYCDAIAAHDLMTRLKGSTVPTTVVLGAMDTAIPHGEAASLAGQFIRSQVLTLDGPHMLHLECPEELNAAIAQHFAWLASAV
jgi:pimeloyl-ACP methyl ester carboxylesterase